jgi:EAL domain-containing protein (putative c-di-GMP-specific phosphodiesterase class I)
MAHTLGLRVVVEGIETPDVASVVTALGCDIGQGYWISRPLPPGELTGWLLGRDTAGSLMAGPAATGPAAR